MEFRKTTQSYTFFLLLLCFVISTLIMTSCANSGPTKRIKTESIEVYDMIESNGEYIQGNLTFAESYVYDEQGNKLKHLIRQKDNTLHREAYIYDNDVLKKSNYYDANDSLLSFYIYEMENGKVKSRYAHEAATNDLLRIDEYDYNENGQLVKHYIKHATGKINRTMAFGYDQNGNEIQVTVRDDGEEIILNEEFRILDLDVDKRWIERWSINGDTPLTVRKRKLEYYD